MFISTEGALKGPLKYTDIVIVAQIDYLLYFNIQRTEKYGVAMYYFNHSCCSYDDDRWETGCGGWVGNISYNYITGQSSEQSGSRFSLVFSRKSFNRGIYFQQVIKWT